MLSRRRDRLTGDDGTTLAELVTCMAVTTVVAAIALSFFVWTGQATRATTTDSFTNQNARAALTTTAGLLRLTVPGSVQPGAVDTLTGVSTTVSAAVSDNVVASCPRRPATSITFTVANGALQLSRTGPVSAPTSSQPCAFQAAVTTTRVLATNVQRGTGFTYGYRAADGQPSTAPSSIGTIGFTLVVAAVGGRVQTYTASAVVSGG